MKWSELRQQMSPEARERMDAKEAENRKLITTEGGMRAIFEKWHDAFADERMDDKQALEQLKDLDAHPKEAALRALVENLEDMSALAKQDAAAEEFGFEKGYCRGEQRTAAHCARELRKILDGAQ